MVMTTARSLRVLFQLWPVQSWLRAELQYYPDGRAETAM